MYVRRARAQIWVDGHTRKYVVGWDRGVVGVLGESKKARLFKCHTGVLCACMLTFLGGKKNRIFVSYTDYVYYKPRMQFVLVSLTERRILGETETMVCEIL